MAERNKVENWLFTSTKKTILVVPVAIALLILFVLPAGSSSDASWIIEGDCVYWNNTKGDVRVCPHTLSGSGWAYFNITSYLPASFNLDFAFGITENIVASKPQIWRNFSHPVLVSNCTVLEVPIVNNGTPGTENRTICNPYYAQNYYLDWQDVGGFSTAQYDGKTGYVRSAMWNSGETKFGRVWLDVKPMSGRSKYSVFLKKASDTFAQAEANGNYVLLDPWVDSPPNVFNETFDTGAFLNGTWGNLNISRGYLILNITGFNATDVLFNNTPAVGGQNCWNSSTDTGDGTGTAAYNCGNLIDTPGSPFATTDVWAQYGTSVPQWVAFELVDTFWLYGFNQTKSFDTQNGRNPANWSVQVSPTAPDRTAAGGPGGDSGASWTYGQFNKTNSAGNAPSSDTIVFGPVRGKALRMHVSNQNLVGNQVYLETVNAFRSSFNTSGQKMSILLNDTITVDKINVTCVNTTGAETGVGMNITVMDRNYANEQTVQCNSDSAKGFENDIANIDGLIYRVNFSSKHSGITPELDFLTLRVKEASGSSFATEAQGDTAIEAGINSSLPSATKYSEQQVYVRNLSNNHTLGRFDWVASYGSQRWLFNYVTAGESYVNAPNLTTAVYVLEVADKTSAQITDEVSKFINATKS